MVGNLKREYSSYTDKLKIPSLLTKRGREFFGAAWFGFTIFFLM